MYLHPSRVDEALLDLAAREPRLCPYFDIPLQHSEDAILRAMNRRPLSRDIRALIGRIRAVVPAASIRTTFIAGFPGETEQLFGNLLKFVEEMRLDKVGVFPFSAEEGTEAFTMRPRPRNATASRRCEMLMSAQRKISGEIGASRVGKIMEVIIDAAPGSPSAPFEGRTRGDAPEIDGKVHVRGTGLLPGDIVPVRITSADEYDLFGTVAQ
jgi:ribosomal protein S12 methylthiotransferase